MRLNEEVQQLNSSHFLTLANTALFSLIHTSSRVTTTSSKTSQNKGNTKQNNSVALVDWSAI